MTDHTPPFTSELEAEAAIRNLVAKYCDAVAAADAETFASCWATDAQWVIPNMPPRVGNDAEAFASRRAKYALTVQEPISGVVSPATDFGQADGIVGSARWLIRETLWYRDGSPTVVVFGRYDDVYKVEGGAVRFARRALTFLYRGSPDLSDQPAIIAPAFDQ